MKTEIELADQFMRRPVGRLAVMTLDTQGRIIRVLQKRNLIMFAGADLMARALGGAGNRMDYLYLEFTNGTLPSDPLAGSPRQTGIVYYRGLSTPQDYLRIPITIAPVFQATSADYQNNSVMFSGLSAGFTQGEHGVAFTNGVSKVYGAALASKGDTAGDPAMDIVFSRNYFLDPGEPITKAANQQVAVFWSINFY